MHHMPEKNSKLPAEDTPKLPEASERFEKPPGFGRLGAYAPLAADDVKSELLKRVIH